MQQGGWRIGGPIEPPTLEALVEQKKHTEDLYDALVTYGKKYFLSDAQIHMVGTLRMSLYLLDEQIEEAMKADNGNNPLN